MEACFDVDVVCIFYDVCGAKISSSLHDDADGDGDQCEVGENRCHGDERGGVENPFPLRLPFVCVLL